MNEEVIPKKSRKVSSKIKTFVKKPIVKRILLVLVVVACAYGIFYLGQKSGAAKQKELDKKTVSSASQSNKRTLSSASRKTFIGTIASVNNKEIEIAPRTGDKVKVTINDETRITGIDAKKVDVNALKKDQKVIVSTTKDKKGTYTSTRIRIQK